MVVAIIIKNYSKAIPGSYGNPTLMPEFLKLNYLNASSNTYLLYNPPARLISFAPSGKAHFAKMKLEKNRLKVYINYGDCGFQGRFIAEQKI